jgi:hypothetical protein
MPNIPDWMAKINPLTGQGFTREEAEHEVRNEVFGHDYKVDAFGDPIEQGKGSVLQQMQHHRDALAKQAARDKILQQLTGGGEA